MKERLKQSKQKIETASTIATRWIGSSASVVLHTLFFGLMLILPFFGINFEKILLVLTTIVSLEAIYLSIFIQMTVNRHTTELENVSEDIEDIQQDVEEIAEDIEEIEKDVDEIQKDVDEIQEDVDEIQEDVEVIEEEQLPKDNDEHTEKLEKIQRLLEGLAKDVENLKKK